MYILNMYAAFEKYVSSEYFFFFFFLIFSFRLIRSVIQGTLVYVYIIYIQTNIPFGDGQRFLRMSHLFIVDKL